MAAGAALLETLGRAIAAGVDGGPALERQAASARRPDGPAVSAAGGLLERDERTGRTYLKMPLPEKETLQRIVELLAGLVGKK